MLVRGFIFLIAVAALGASSRTAVPAVEAKPHPCRVPGVPGQGLCASYPVWEDRERGAGRKIGLQIVILPALGGNHAPDPLFILAGGPGAAATEMIPGFSRNRALRERRDLVFVDQRGTGGSNPLDCDFYGDPPDLRTVAGVSFPVEAIRRCRERLSAIADLGLYTTALGMDDVDEVRRWLGYGKIDLWGGSYGSMAAQVYLRRHGASVRTVVLAGVAPVDELIPLHHARAGQRAMDLLFAACRADAPCRAAYPKLSDEFRAVFESVRSGVEVAVHDAEGRAVRVRPGVSALAEGIRHYLYGGNVGALPGMIHRAAAGDLAPLVQTAIAAELNLMRGISLGMLLSVTCAEQIPYIDDATLARETANTFLGGLRVQEQRAACREWVQGAVPADVHRLVQSNVPVLLISGNRDPVTPPEFGERVAKQLPNSLHVVFPEASHGNWGACGRQIEAQFIERGAVQGLDVSCAAARTPPRFVIEPGHAAQRRFPAAIPPPPAGLSAGGSAP
ncbi:MAG: alpha/beta hydrolase [Acidobacteriia bacterium]|nr:alpha/beta hydrolase [Terriglobia bacterium]